jgi:hypothetical protein
MNWLAQVTVPVAELDGGGVRSPVSGVRGRHFGVVADGVGWQK